MNKAYNIHIFCVDRETVMKYMGVISRCIAGLQESVIDYINDDNFFCANEGLKEILILDELRSKINNSRDEIEKYGLFQESEEDDNGQEDEPEATDDELL